MNEVCVQVSRSFSLLKFSIFVVVVATCSLSSAFAFVECKKISAKIAEKEKRVEIPEFKAEKILTAAEERAIGEAMIVEEREMLLQILDSKFSVTALKNLQEELKRDPQFIRRVIKMKEKGKEGEPLTEEQNALVRQTRKNLKYLIGIMEAYHLAKPTLQKSEQKRQLEKIQMEFFKMDWARMFYNKHLIQPLGMSSEKWAKLQTLLLDFNKGLVYFKVFKSAAAFDERFEIEELYAVGREAMRTAVLYYEPSYSFKFSTTAGLWIQQSIKRFAAREREAKHLSLDSAKFDSEGNSVRSSLGSSIATNTELDPAAALEKVDSQSLKNSPIEDLLSKIPADEAQILRFHFGIGVKALGWEQMGRSLGKDHGTLRAKKDSAIQRLKAFSLINAGELTYQESYVLAQKYLNFPARSNIEIAKDLKLPRENISILEESAFEKWEIKKGPLLRAFLHR
ncbi:MAG: hypothetical protein J0L93_05175 [Deltaproteobacteria bacterium]|nr:hypothetical protein [Deltaproteobacteria bacterium]